MRRTLRCLNLFSFSLGLVANQVAGATDDGSLFSGLAKERTFENLKAYIQEHGGFVSEVLADPRESANAGWGLFFAHNVSAGETIEPWTVLQIPQRLLICNKSEGDDLIVQLAEAFINNRSHYITYLNSLPRESEALWSEWTDEELSELGNQNVIDYTQKQKLHKEQLFQQHRLNKTLEVSFSDFKILDYIVSSRSFDVNGWLCLVPLADLPNHDPVVSSTYWGWAADDKTGELFYEMTSEEIAISGREFRITYNQGLTNEQMLIDYGFCHIDNPFQRVDWDLPEGIPHFEQKLSIAPRIVLVHHVDVRWLLFMSRLIVAGSEQFSQHTLTLPVSQRNEVDALRACAAHLREQHPRNHLLRMEWEYSLNSKLSQKRRTILAYKIAYARLYERAASFCDHLLIEIQCMSSWRLQALWRQTLGRGSPKTFERIKRNIYVGGKPALCNRYYNFNE